MVIGLKNGLYDFQKEVVTYLIDTTNNPASKQGITIKAPTGSGKTLILIDYIDKYLNINPNTAFIWLCPGKGDLEEQSREKMIKHLPNRETKNLLQALNSGFETQSTTFINWELITNKNNKAIQDSEKKNLYDRIAYCHRNGIDFIIIIDEEHSNNTAKALDMINHFSAKHIIRVSATAVKNDKYEYKEVNEYDVIQSGLITKAISVNEDVEENSILDDDILLELAEIKRNQIAMSYKRIYEKTGENVNPLVLIQFPCGEAKRITMVEKKLAELGYTYENGTVSKWMSEDKADLPDNLTENNATPCFLLMKQAISTGWDCPRAKILVKLREGGTEAFQIQTIGRIRRMPNAHHYEVNELDLCYVYTFDEEYKAGLLSSLDKSYVSRTLELKDKCKTFNLKKELKDPGYDGISEKEAYIKIKKFYQENYKLGKDKKMNKKLLEEAKYIFGYDLHGKVFQGEIVYTSSLLKNDDSKYIATKSEIDTSKHGLLLIHSVNELRKILGISDNKIKVILEKLFRNNYNVTDKFLALNTKEFYAFIINNIELLKNDFRQVAAQISTQYSFDKYPPKIIEYSLPKYGIYKYDPLVKDELEYLSNAYIGYSSGFTTTEVRSMSEHLFEDYCEKNTNVEWVYKNGDSGQQYLSIVYETGSTQRLFYPDYIVKLKNDDIWIIETKGGETKNKSNNIDIQIQNKFEHLKRYAETYNLKWGFVRNKDTTLYINNTIFSLNMNTENWVLLNTKF